MNTNDPNADTQPSPLRRVLTRYLLTHENLIALALCLILIALVIATADTAPQWIYQGF